MNLGFAFDFDWLTSFITLIYVCYAKLQDLCSLQKETNWSND